MSQIQSRESAKVKAWNNFQTKATSIIEVPNWDTLTPRQKKIAVNHTKNMNSLLN
tara:strand:+ start:1603 stop:1767 length:165 start_codon:yes stop_codon:yes gene_type:complete